jgi:hypothetical protein
MHISKNEKSRLMNRANNWLLWLFADFFDIIALSEPLDGKLVASKPSRDQIAKAINGKVVAWGRWVGQCERKWK